MIRSTSHLAAVCSGALMLGMVLGSATNMSRVSVRSAYASEQQGRMKDADPAPAKDQAPAGKGGAGARCKTTKNCQANMTCVKAGDHKECTVTPIKVPEAPVVT